MLAILPVSFRSDGEPGSEESEIPCAGSVLGKAGSEAIGELSIEEGKTFRADFALMVYLVLREVRYPVQVLCHLRRV